MASISRQPNGHRMIQFVGADRKRRSIRLGKIASKQAERVRLMVESLVAASIAGFPVDSDVGRWVAGLDDSLHEKLAAVGLIPPRESQLLGPFLDSYIRSRVDVQRGTRLMYDQTRNALIEFFGAEKRLRDITAGDGDEWVLWMVGKGWAQNTCRKRSAIAKLFFNSAVRKRLLTESPLRDLKGTVRPNESRLRFISVADIEKVIAQTADPEWKLIIALARYAGLRTPSETMALKWEDVNWAEGRMVVWSPKTAHHAGKEYRVVPMFPALRPYLEAAFEAAAEGAVHVIAKHRARSGNLRTQMHRLIRRAGMEPWTRPFHNLRASCETELADQFPAHVVSKWLGNSQQVAAAHYLQVTDEHFERARTTACSALQKALQQVAEASGNDSQANLENPVIAGVCESVRFDASPYSVRDYSREDSSGSAQLVEIKSTYGEQPAEALQNPVQSAADEQLRQIAVRWHALPETLRHAIWEMVLDYTQ